MGLDGCGRLLCARDSSRIGQVPALVLGITLLVLVELNMDAAKIFGHSTEPHAPMAQVKPKEFEITVSQVAGTSDNSQSAKTSPSRSDTSSTTRETPKTETKTSEQTEKDQKSSEKAPLEDGKCPNDKPLCKLSVAILMTGHIFDSFSGSGGHSKNIRNYIHTCRHEVKSCEVYIHTWRQKSPTTKSYRARKAGEMGQGDYQSLCEKLDCTGMIVDSQSLGNLNLKRQWLKSGMSFVGTKMIPYALDRVNTLRKEHNRAFNRSHDIVIRIRPDYYRTPHGDVMPSSQFRNCLSTVDENKLYGTSGLASNGRRRSFFPGGSRPRRLMKNGQVSRPWDGNSGDNFFYARAEAFDKIVSMLYRDWESLAGETEKWNELNPEAVLGTVAEKVGLSIGVCG
uniref:Uncharacterized protein n=1 Tax=Amorphochlora amoebiformis TaxID=1561963 RepID=A0A7S0GT38_9EUKA|mmetsp:Transcript_16595/g.26296  ORF Transcript_16595/g.26296 Transcript_16595/m.26296 type:complete len:396 (+) Transcript_16595:141-1328(+)